MISGKVIRGPYGLEPHIAIQITNESTGAREEVRVVVDTGSTGELILPKGKIAELGLPLLDTSGLQILADGTRKPTICYEAVVHLHGHERRTIVVESADEHPVSVMGFRLLEGSKVTIDARDGGDVRIEER